VEEVFDESNKKFRILQQKIKPYLFRSQSLVLSCMLCRINEWYSNRQFCFSRVGQISVSSSNLTKTPSGTNSKKDCLEEVTGEQLVKKFFAFS
jgi:hypothetical protein